MEKLVLIDGNSLINRAFYAMPVLSTKNGVFTNAVYGFMNMFIKMLSDEKPSNIAVAFDLKAPTFRHKMFDGYKGTRKPMPEELRPQIPLLKELLTSMGVRCVEKEGFEADDLIGTIAKHTDIKTIIITGDKDALQLVDEQTEVHFTRRGLSDVDIYTHLNFKEKTGITPPQIIELKALMGDSSDNIPGVSGVGEKTALTLVQTYKNVENLYDNLADLKGKLKEKIVSGKESAFLSKTLATIDVDCPIDYSLSSMAFTLPFNSQVRSKFIELEFKSLANKENLFELSSNENNADFNEVKKSVEVVKVDDLSTLNKLCGSPLTIYISNNLVSVYDGKTEYIVSVAVSLIDVGFQLSQILNALKNAFCGKERLTVFNKKELAHLIFDTLGVNFTAPSDDVALMKYLADYTKNSETANSVIEEYGLSLNTPAYSLAVIKEKLSAGLKKDNLEKLYYEVELPLVDVLFDMEQAGFKVDANALIETGAKFKEQLTELESQIRALTDSPSLNVNSPKQLGDVLFEKLKIGKGKKTKSGYSTTAEVLESLESSHPAIPLIIKFRQLQKLLSTYIDGFKPLINKQSGLIHTSFNQTATATGRLSSKEPNLQNIPVRDEQGKYLRKFFVARSDEHLLIGADYSQIELRLLAEFSKCKTLVDAFKNGKDIHAITASKVFKVPLDKVTSQMRSSAKAVNFGIIYGMSEYGLAKQLHISSAQARDYINAYFLEYPEVKEYMLKNVEFAKQNGFSLTMLNRKRTIPELLSTNYMTRQFGERIAMNMPLQGSAADIIKIAMLKVAKKLKEENLKSKLILQVHDELIIDALMSEREEVEKILIEQMEGAVELGVPLTVNVGSGKTWFDAK